MWKVDDGSRITANGTSSALKKKKKKVGWTMREKGNK